MLTSGPSAYGLDVDEDRHHRDRKDGGGFAEALSPKHEVRVGSRDPEGARKIAAKTGAASGTTYADAAAKAHVVILTVPWAAMEATLAELGDLRGSVVVDVSYPYNQREREALKGRSTAEWIQDRLPKAKVFKGWNHVHARHLTAPEVDGIASSVLIAGDDAKGKRALLGLARDMLSPACSCRHVRTAGSVPSS